jgi:hypothetical protein
MTIQTTDTKYINGAPTCKLVTLWDEVTKRMPLTNEDARRRLVHLIKSEPTVNALALEYYSLITDIGIIAKKVDRHA